MVAGASANNISGGTILLGRYPVRPALALFAALLFSLVIVAYGTAVNAPGTAAPWLDVSDRSDSDRDGDEAPDGSSNGGSFGVAETGDDFKALVLGMGGDVNRLRSADALLRNNPASADSEPAGSTIPPQLLERPPPRR
jgi:hypothetical protein